MVFTKPNCPWCDKAKVMLTSCNEQYVAFDIEAVPRLKTMLLTMGLTTVPQVFHGPRHIGGFEDLTRYMHARMFRS